MCVLLGVYGELRNPKGFPQYTRRPTTHSVSPKSVNNNNNNNKKQRWGEREINNVRLPSLDTFWAITHGQ